MLFTDEDTCLLKFCLKKTVTALVDLFEIFKQKLKSPCFRVLECKFVLITKRQSHMGFRLIPKLVTSNSVMAIILRYFAEFSSLHGQLRKSVWFAINKFSPEKCHKVHQLRTTDALWSSQSRSFLFSSCSLQNDYSVICCARRWKYCGDWDRSW